MSEIINVTDVPTRVFHSGPRFEAALGDIDGAVGTTQICATLHVVPPGKTAWPYHRHHGNDEIFFVVSGEGTYRVGDRRLPIKAGDMIGAPAGGEAHQIINTSTAELRYFAFANRVRADVIEYPDSGRIAVDIAHGNDKDPPSIFSVAGQLSPQGYWDGEDIGDDK
jgi:uncharacterized cupin superfamily protein